jgi:hypothetical protein
MVRNPIATQFSVRTLLLAIAALALSYALIQALVRERGASLSGRVHGINGKPLPDAAITLDHIGLSLSYTSSLVTDQNGEYRVHPVRRGLTSFDRNDDPFTVLSISVAHAGFVGQTCHVRIPFGDDVEFVRDFTLVPTGALRCEISNEIDSGPAVGLSCFFSNEQIGSRLQAITDSTGSLLLSDLAPGKYRIEVASTKSNRNGVDHVTVWPSVTTHAVFRTDGESFREIEQRYRCCDADGTGTHVSPATKSSDARETSAQSAVSAPISASTRQTR